MIHTAKSPSTFSSPLKELVAHCRIFDPPTPLQKWRIKIFFLRNYGIGFPSVENIWFTLAPEGGLKGPKLARKGLKWQEKA